MKPEEIKAEYEKQLSVIIMAKNRISQLRNICEHKMTHKGNYSWRVGSTELVDICDFCGEPLPNYSGKS